MNKIFLSYAQEDRNIVAALYLQLREAGLCPWMDQPPFPFEFDGIPPGEEWEASLRKNLKEASVVLAFLSRTSVRKKGYVQKEYRLALSYAMEAPDKSFSLIPVLLEECEIPDYLVDTMSMKHFQWYKLYAYEDGRDRLVKFLVKRASEQESEQEEDLERIILDNALNLLEKTNRDKDRRIRKLREEYDQLVSENAALHEQYNDLESQHEAVKIRLQECLARVDTPAELPQRKTATQTQR